MYPDLPRIFKEILTDTRSAGRLAGTRTGLNEGDHMAGTIKITTLRMIETCPDNRTCPSIHAVADAPDVRYVITKKITDPAMAAAFAHLVGDDEQLGTVPAELIPEV